MKFSEKINQFNKELNSSKEAFEKKYQIRIQMPRITYASKDFRTRLTFVSFNNLSLSIIKAAMSDFKALLSPIESKLKIKFDYGRVTYDRTDFRFTLKAFDAENQSGDATEIQGKLNLDRYGKPYGLSSADYNRIFDGKDGSKYALIGFNPKARKNCFQIFANGTQYNCPPSFLGLELSFKGFEL